MCGIAGFIEPERPRHDAERLIDRMCQVIRHRGPDGQGTWGGDGVALGTRRLAIIDLTGGDQPIFNEDQSVLVVFNGEIYNYRQLQETLRQRGHSFRTNSDTEVIVHAYEEYGDACVHHLRGMFTFALWDRNRQRLLAARDRFGKKPLNYYWDGHHFIFGSEIKSILEVGIPREINAIALDEYLAHGYVPTPNTLFKGVFKLPAAHILVYEDGQISLQRYWKLSFIPTCQDDEATAIARTRELLRDAVRVRLMSEVPLGVFLSGGIDSSTVVGLMSSMSAQPVKTCSIGFEEDDDNEVIYARQVAQHFGTDHHEFVVRPDLVSVLPELAWAYDEPFADPSMLPTYYVSRLAREHVTVALTGDGGDEIFGGYSRYAQEAAIQNLPGLGRFFFNYASRLMPDGMRGKRRLRQWSRELPTRYVHALAYVEESTRSLMYHPDFFAEIRQHAPLERQISEFAEVSHLDIMSQMQHVDVCTYLTDDILVKVDKASMINSLETRAPLLDQHLVEYVASLPATIRTRGNVLKYLLKKAADGIVPPTILTRPKRGFGVPLRQWFRSDLISSAQDLLDSPRARQRSVFNPAFICRLLQEHASSRRVDHSNAIWALLALELWFQVYRDQPTLPLEGSAQRQLTNF